MRQVVASLGLALACLWAAAELRAQDDPDTVQVLNGFAINGRLATRGAVLRTADGRVSNDGGGQRTWVEYDDHGRKYDVVPGDLKQDMSLDVQTPAAFCARSYPDAQSAERSACLAKCCRSGPMMA